MNAKIKITVPIDKVHLKIASILKEVCEELNITAKETAEIAEQTSKSQDLLLQLDKIDKLRKKMALLDSNLEDCYDVIDGLVKYKTNNKGKEDAKSSAE
jgi:hypothetical protein